MRAQQVVDLNNARNRIAEILPLLEKIQAKLGMTDGTKGLYNTAQISVAVVNGTLRIYGAQQLIADGYVPYLFRHTRKRNQWGDKLVIEAGGATNRRRNAVGSCGASSGSWGRAVRLSSGPSR